MQVKVYNQAGKEIGEIELNAQIFDVKPNEELIHMALVRQQANARLGLAKTKTRGEVRGGGRKPFKQKGTGRARRGSEVSPVLVGGGIVFGPQGNRNFEIRMPKKQRRQALFGLLSQKAQAGEVIVLEGYSDKDMKTKNFAELLVNLEIERNALFVVDREAKEDLIRVSRNIPMVKAVIPGLANIADLLKYRKVVFLKNALPELESTFLTS
jgi:large subunit ribosomal protein L4